VLIVVVCKKANVLQKPGVSVNKSIWGAAWIATTTFFVLGYFGALSYHFPADGDILSMLAFCSGVVWCRIGAHIVFIVLKQGCIRV
jgi:hypothetical protein